MLLELNRGGKKGSGEEMGRVFIKTDVLGGPHRSTWGRLTQACNAPALNITHPDSLWGRVEG